MYQILDEATFSSHFHWVTDFPQTLQSASAWSDISEEEGKEFENTHH